jgi:hypothetical protein
MSQNGSSRITDDRGAVASILLFPVFAVCALLLVQGVFWQQDRTVASSAADRASAAIALYNASPDDAEAEAIARMSTAGMVNVTVSISRDANLTVVVVTGKSHGLLPFTSSTVSARSVTPTETFVSP